MVPPKTPSKMVPSPSKAPVASAPPEVRARDRVELLPTTEQFGGTGTFLDGDGFQEISGATWDGWIDLHAERTPPGGWFEAEGITVAEYRTVKGKDPGIKYALLFRLLEDPTGKSPYKGAGISLIKPESEPWEPEAGAIVALNLSTNATQNMVAYLQGEDQYVFRVVFMGLEQSKASSNKYHAIRFAVRKTGEKRDISMDRPFTDDEGGKAGLPAKHPCAPIGAPCAVRFRGKGLTLTGP